MPQGRSLAVTRSSVWRWRWRRRHLGPDAGPALVASGQPAASLYRYLDRLREAGWQIEAMHDDAVLRE